MKVFMVSPANMATGGTELLHQFSKSLTELGIENYMVYPDRNAISCPTPDVFLKYGVKYVTRYIDISDAVWALAETQVHVVNECVNATPMIWWLSVDNYIAAYKEQIIASDGNLDIFDLKNKPNVLHFVQSQYAKDFVENVLGVEKTYFLKDYINDQIIEVADSMCGALKRENICLYNPKKGLEVLHPIIEATIKDVQWIPLQGMSPDEMARKMCQAKLYVDFGNHPGKDRIPREAAVCGCMVMTNKKGSASYEEDVMIPLDCKIEDTSNIQVIAEKIKELLQHYDERIAEYEPYRLRIRTEKEEFLQEVRAAVDILKKTVEYKQNICGEKSSAHLRVQNDVMTYTQPLSLIRKVLQTMDQMAVDSVNACYEGDAERLSNRLLDMDYMLQLVRETVYAELIDLSQRD